MHININDFNIIYNERTKKYEVISLYKEDQTITFKKYEVDYLGRVSQNIITDISDLTKLGYRYNPNLTKRIPDKKK